VIVAVAIVRVVQMPRNEVVVVVAVRNRLVPAMRSVHVVLGVPRATVRRRARGGVHAADLEHALVDVTLVTAMHVAIM
jgi:hypothetical protein